MKYRMETTIEYLHIELLITILSMLGKTYDGATSFARAMSVNKLFLKASHEVKGLADFHFRNIKIEEDQLHHYQQRKGLIYNCAQAGNEGAQYVLAKVILATSTQLLNLRVPKQKLIDFNGYNPNNNNGSQRYKKKAQPSSFLYHFNHQEPGTSDSLVLTHQKLVRGFLSRPINIDIFFMNKHLQNYIKYFLGSPTPGSNVQSFMFFINTMRTIISEYNETFSVRDRGYNYLQFSREEPVLPPRQSVFLSNTDGNIVWENEIVVFEEFRRQSVLYLDLLTPQLH